MIPKHRIDFLRGSTTTRKRQGIPIVIVVDRHAFDETN